MNEKTKTCADCGKTLPVTEFYTHPNTISGYQRRCKPCARIKMLQRRNRMKLDPVWVEKEKARSREKFRRGQVTRATHEQQKRYAAIFKKRFPEQYEARKACNRLPKLKGCHVHHWSYNEEHRKDVISLTTKQHGLAHRSMIYDQERMMYRRLDGTLIDSREAALAYYATLKHDDGTSF